MIRSTLSKKESGFSLIEVIVTSVIVGILAGVGIPIYYGYIQNQKMSTVSNLAETATASANAFVRKTGRTTDLTDADVPALNLYYDSVTYKVHPNGSNIQVYSIKESAITASKAYK